MKILEQCSSLDLKGSLYLSRQSKSFTNQKGDG